MGPSMIARVMSGVMMLTPVPSSAMRNMVMNRLA